MTARASHLTNLLTTLVFVLIVASPMTLHMLVKGPTESRVEKRRLAPTPTLADARADWQGFPEVVNTWMRDHFGLRRTYLQIGFLVNEVLPTSVKFNAVHGDDGWLFNTLNAALAQHRGLLPYTAGEADAWLDGLEEVQARAEASGAIFLATVPPNKHTIYSEYLSEYPRKVAGETRLGELYDRAEARQLPLIDLRDVLFAAKPHIKVYFQTDSHWTELGAFEAFQKLRNAMIERGFDVPALPIEGLNVTFMEDFQGDLYGLIGEADGPPERVRTVQINRDWPVEPKGSLLIIGDSFSDWLIKFFEVVFEEVTMVGNNGGDMDISAIQPGAYDVVLLEIVERYLINPLEVKSD